jgi:hypothetical protein
MDVWGAFGDSSSDDEDAADSSSPPPIDDDQFDVAADAIALSLTQHFATSTKITGVPLKDRVVGIGQRYSDDLCASKWRKAMSKRVICRGLQSVELNESAMTMDVSSYQCDAAIVIENKQPLNGDNNNESSSHVRRSLLPGGYLWSIIPLDGVATSSDKTDDGDELLNKRLIDEHVNEYSESIWNLGSASVIYSSSAFLVLSLQKRSCVINTWSCVWMNKKQRIDGQLLSSKLDDNNDEFPIHKNMTYLQYERNAACSITVSPSVMERTSIKLDEFNNPNEKPVYATVLTESNVRRATDILNKHGLVIIKGLLPPSQTVPWGDAVLADFNAAVSRLRNHPTRPVDLLNPHTADSFEPLSYREMAMREDLRVDLRSGPNMEILRRSQNELGYSDSSESNESNYSPSIIHADVAGAVGSWRKHPSILSIIRSAFNPKEDSLFKGNFGRWNFGGDGPDGSPQPFRLGQIGSVLSCPGSGDQAIHADTPHLFEHINCLPCHYMNIFTPGYQIINDSVNDCFRNEYDCDGVWTGNSTMGGTAFIHGSHMLRVSAQLLSEDNKEHIVTDKEEDNSNYTDAAMNRKNLLQLRTLRPSLDVGDVLFFDCRTIHYGLANTSHGDKTGIDVNAGRRPLLYLNVTQSWFHDPKNWDDRERIFE